jgi:hypothetical protein
MDQLHTCEHQSSVGGNRPQSSRYGEAEARNKGDAERKDGCQQGERTPEHGGGYVAKGQYLYQQLYSLLLENIHGQSDPPAV